MSKTIYYYIGIFISALGMHLSIFTFERRAKEDIISDVLEDPKKVRDLKPKELKYLQETLQQKKQQVSEQLKHLETYHGEGVERLTYERTLSMLQLLETDIAEDSVKGKAHPTFNHDLEAAFEGKSVTQPALKLLRDSFEEQAALFSEHGHPLVARIKSVVHEIEQIQGDLSQQTIQTLIEQTRQTASALIVKAFNQWIEERKALTFIAQKVHQYVESIQSIQLALDKLGSGPDTIACIDEKATQLLKDHFTYMMNNLLETRSFHPFMTDVITLLNLGDRLLSLSIDQVLVKRVRSNLQDKAIEGIKVTLERSMIVKSERDIHSMLIKIQAFEHLEPHLDQEHQEKLADHKKSLFKKELKQFIDSSKKTIATFSPDVINNEALTIMHELKIVQTFLREQQSTMPHKDLQEIQIKIKDLEKTLHNSIISSAQKIMEKQVALLHNKAIETWQFFESLEQIVITYNQLQKLFDINPQFKGIIEKYQSFITQQDVSRVFKNAKHFLTGLMVKQPTTNQMKQLINGIEQVLRVMGSIDSLLEPHKRESYRKKFVKFYQTILKQPIDVLKDKILRTKLNISTSTMTTINKTLERFEIKVSR